MSMQESEEVLTPAELALPADVQARLRIGRKAERDAAEASAKLAASELRNDVLEAGVPNHPAREAVFEKYTGERTPEAIRAYAESMGIMTPVVAAPSGPTAEEIAGQRRIIDASVGAPPAAGGDVDLAVALKNCQSEAEVQAILEQVSGKEGFTNQEGLIGLLDRHQIPVRG
jgi:non-canonical (house-cleaning) NTP pyrophosphatase